MASMTVLNSPMYETLRSTAIAFAHSTALQPSPSSASSACQQAQQDSTHILSLRTPDCTTSFGHRLFASNNPMTNHTLNNAEFLAHMARMTPFLASVRTDVHDVLIDELRRSAVVRMSFFMAIAGASEDGGDEIVENDMVWFLEMEETGEKVKSAVEYLDAAATGRIGALVAKVKQAKERKGPVQAEAQMGGTPNRITTTA